jgi:hypothetical protein
MGLSVGTSILGGEGGKGEVEPVMESDHNPKLATIKSVMINTAMKGFCIDNRRSLVQAIIGVDFSVTKENVAIE